MSSSSELRLDISRGNIGSWSRSELWLKTQMPARLTFWTPTPLAKYMWSYSCIIVLVRMAYSVNTMISPYEIIIANLLEINSLQWWLMLYWESSCLKWQPTLLMTGHQNDVIGWQHFDDIIWAYERVEGQAPSLSRDNPFVVQYVGVIFEAWRGWPLDVSKIGLTAQETIFFVKLKIFQKSFFKNN